MNRRVKMIRAAIPYFDAEKCDYIELLLHAEELREIMSGGKSRTDLSICGKREMDVEGLLIEIKALCNDEEEKIVNQFLSFFQLKRMLEMVQMMKSMMPSSEEANENNESGNDFSSLFSDMPLTDMMDFFMSMAGEPGKE